MSNLKFVDINGGILVVTDTGNTARVLKTTDGSWIFSMDRAYVIPVDDLREILQEVDQREAKNDD